MNTMKHSLRFGVLASAILMAVATQSRATMYDLSTAGSNCVVNGATFMTVDIAPTGTGNIHSFVRVHANGDEEGYNTDAKKFRYDEVGGGFTHSLLLSAVPQVQLTQGGAWFYEFGLDINQEDHKALLSLDRLMIFRETVPSLEDGTGKAVPLGSLGTPLYDLDGGADNWIKLNADLSAGSGKGDVYAYVPTSLLAGGTGNYLYLYSQFGAQGGDYKSNGGFEEWFVRNGSTEPPRVPAPAAALLGMFGLTTAGWRLRRFA